jgi:hypothetical protein
MSRGVRTRSGAPPGAPATPAALSRTLELARAEVDRFVVLRARDLAAELSEQARDLQTRYETRRAAIAELEDEWTALRRAGAR